MILQPINVQEPDYITPENINTFEKAQQNDNVRVVETKGKGKHHGKKYYSGKYESKEKPIKIDGKFYESAHIDTTEKGKKAEVKSYVSHKTNRLMELAEAFNNRIDSKYTEATQRIWSELTKENPSLKAEEDIRKLSRWLQLYSFIEFGLDNQKSSPERFLYSSRFTSNLYQMLYNHLEQPDSNNWSDLKAFWNKAAKLKF